MNLAASTTKGPIKLWQTPTQISYTILPSNYGGAAGKEARDALVRYMEWVSYSTNGVWNSDADLTAAKQQVAEHLAYVRGFLDDETLRVWVE
jgi:hypothetical protein